MIKKVKWGVIGSGGIARRRTIPEGIMSSKIADLVVVSNAEVAREYGVSYAEDASSLLQADIDAVYIASPVHLHIDQVVQSARAKKHVLCEKPLGLTVREASKMNEVCNQMGVLLGTGFMMRFNAQHQAALKIIEAGKLGQLVYGRAQLSCWYPQMNDAWRQNPRKSGGGSLMDLGSHCIDIMQMFFGDILSVYCSVNNNVHSYEVEDSAVVILNFMNGAFATIDAYFCIPDTSSKNALEIYGTHGSLIANGTLGQQDNGEMRAFLEANNHGYEAKQTRKKRNGVPIHSKPINTYLAEIEEFSLAILENRQPYNSGKIGLQNQKVISACYQSARTGKVVTLK